MHEPLVSIIIVNWNGEKFIDICLSSLRNQTYYNFEVIVVDNGSTDNSVKLLEEKYLNFIKIIKNPVNLGFAKGNNIGIDLARGEFIITLNNDIQADARWLEELVEAAQSDQKIGMCASKINSFYNRNIIDSVGVNIYWDGMSRGRGRLKEDIGQYDRDKEILIPSACAALYKKKMLDEVGVFDEDFFAYCEDTDLGLRARMAGWKCVLVTSAIAYHLYSATSGKYSSFKAFMVERNHIWVALKIFPALVLMISPFFTLVRLIIQTLSLLRYSFYTDVNNEKLLKMQLFLEIVKAYISAFKSLPAVLKKRKIIWSNKKITNSEIYDWFRRFRLNARDLVLN